jgi:DNA-3-methyladenine glycosylase II
VGADGNGSLTDPARLRAARRHLRSADPVLRQVIDQVGPCRVPIVRDPFAALASSIVHQQLSMSAAGTILGRLHGLCPGRRLTPAALAGLAEPQLRSAGLSRQKMRYLADLAAHFADGRVRSARLRRLMDEEVVAAVTPVLGIGRWTAQMLLIFCLGRPDVWPTDDLGIRLAIKRLYHLRGEPRVSRLDKVAEPWRPYRSVASWYLWRSLGGDRVPGFRNP